MAAGPGFHSTDVGGYKRISGDCVSWADNLVDEKAMIKSTANLELKIIFIDGCFSLFSGARVSIKFAILLCCFNVAPRPARDVFLLIECQLPANFCGRSE